SGILALIASFLLLLQAFNSAHLLLVRHAVCAEHGEAIEAGPHASPQSGSETDRDRVAQTAEGTGDAEHEHCQIAAGERTARVLTALIVAAEPLSPVVLAIASEAPAPVLDAETYRDAPKTSPPSLT